MKSVREGGSVIYPHLAGRFSIGAAVDCHLRKNMLETVAAHKPPYLIRTGCQMNSTSKFLRKLYIEEQLSAIFSLMLEYYFSESIFIYS